MRLYDVAVASLAVGAPTRWTDNLVSQHELPGVSHRQRGIARGISWNALLHIALIRELHERLGCGLREAVALAIRLLDDPRSESRLGPIHLAFDRADLERTLDARLRDALESAPRPRRGRPPRRVRGLVG